MTVIIVEKGSDVYSAKYNAANVSTKDKTNPKTCDQGNPL
jgi:hypothetical protein